MTTFKVIANKLNLRSFPVSDFNNKGNVVGTLMKDAIFESVDAIENELGRWQVGANGQVVSERWLTEAQSRTFDKLRSTEANAVWMDFLGIPEVWKKTKGESVCVAVLDSGFDLNNTELIRQLYKYDEAPSDNLSKVCKNFINPTESVQDNFGHGTHCASLISSNNSTHITGIAPEAKLFIGKINNGGLDDFNPITAGILWASNIEEVDIISISNGLSGIDQTLPDLKKAMQLALSKNKIVISGIGNRSNDPEPLYPALFEECISVGAIQSDGTFYDETVESSFVKIYAPGKDILSHFLNGEFATLSGTSQSTAIVAGFAALIVSHLKKTGKAYTKKMIEELILNNCSQVLNNPNKKYINPIKLFTHI